MKQRRELAIQPKERDFYTFFKKINCKILEMEKKRELAIQPKERGFLYFFLKKCKAKKQIQFLFSPHPVFFLSSACL